MTNCSHTFAYWSVVPPSHCPRCGACLGCGSGPVPVAPYPGPWPYTPTRWPQWWQTGPIYTTTVHTSNTTSTGTLMNAVSS